MSCERFGFDPGDLVDFVLERLGARPHMFVLDPELRIWDVVRTGNEIRIGQEELHVTITCSCRS